MSPGVRRHWDMHCPLVHVGYTSGQSLEVEQTMSEQSAGRNVPVLPSQHPAQIAPGPSTLPPVVPTE